MNRAENRRLWLTRIEEQANSGLNQTKWCELNGLSLHALKYWRHKVSCHEPSVAEAPKGFVAIQSNRILETSTIRINIGCASVEVDPGVDPDLLGEVVRVLSRHA